VKQRLIQVLQEIVAQHQERRAKITDEDVKKWMTERCIL
jgi:tryptophanyl-tRNA synthetase